MTSINKQSKRNSNLLKVGNAYRTLSSSYDDLKDLALHHPFGKRKRYVKGLSSLNDVAFKTAKFSSKHGYYKLMGKLGKISSQLVVMIDRDKMLHGLRWFVIPLKRQEDLSRLSDVLGEIKEVLETEENLKVE